MTLENFVRSHVNVSDESHGITVTSPTRIEEAGIINYVHRIGNYFVLPFFDRLSSAPPLPSFVVCTSLNLFSQIFALLSVNQFLCFSLLFYLLRMYYTHLPYLAIFKLFAPNFKFLYSLKTLQCSNDFREYRNVTLGTDRLKKTVTQWVKLKK